MGGELVFHLQVVRGENELLALQGSVDEAGHQLLGPLLDLLAVTDRQPGHAAEVVSLEPAFQLQPLVLVQGEQLLNHRQTVSAVVHADARRGVVTLQQRDDLGDVRIGNVFKMHAQDHLQQRPLADLHLLEYDNLGGVVGVAQVAADPELTAAGREVEQHLQPVVGRFLGVAVAQLGIGDDDLLVLQQILPTEVELLDIEGPIGGLAVFTGHLVLPAGAVAAAVELQQFGLAIFGPQGIEPGRPAEHMELIRRGEPVIGGVAQAVGRGVDA